MNRQSYMTRAMKARDPRFADILGKLGYETREQAPADATPPQAPKGDGAPDLATLRQRYKDVVGKKPFNGWDADTLAAKIAEHQAQA
jgi:hypothetical protein